MIYCFVLFSGTTGNLVTNPRAYSVGCRPPSLLTGSSSSVSTTGSGSSHHHSRHKSRFIDIPGATTASGTSGTGTGSQASSFRCVSTVVKFSFYEKTTKFWCILPLRWRRGRLSQSRYLSELDFWNVNLGIYYKLKKKIDFESNLIFFRVWTWFLLPV